ncbi:MAG TPA: hypothetical protein VGA23_00205 [Methylomirabilota bacterium]
MRRRPFQKWNAALLAALLTASGCAGGGTPASREPGFRAASVRRPALLVRVTVPAELDQRDRDRISENYQAAVVEGLERLGILAVDMATVPGTSSRPLEGLDRPAALRRAREAGAEQLVIVDARLAKDTLTHCRRAGRAVSGSTTFWDVGLEIRRVADTQPLLVEPPAEDFRAVDVELDCKTGRLIRRKSMDELITDSVGLVLAPFASR